MAQHLGGAPAQRPAPRPSSRLVRRRRVAGLGVGLVGVEPDLDRAGTTSARTGASAAENAGEGPVVGRRRPRAGARAWPGRPSRRRSAPLAHGGQGLGEGDGGPGGRHARRPAGHRRSAPPGGRGRRRPGRSRVRHCGPPPRRPARRCRGSRTRWPSSRYFTTAPSVAATAARRAWSLPEQRQRPGPVDGLGDARRLVEAERRGSPPTAAATWRASVAGHLGRPQAHDRHLALEVGLLDPVVEAAALEGVVHVAGAVRGQHGDRRDRRPGRCRARGSVTAQSASSSSRNASNSSSARSISSMSSTGGGPSAGVYSGRSSGRRTRNRSSYSSPSRASAPVAAARPGGLGRPQVQQLAGVVPLVKRLGGVDALVALEADQPAAGPGGQRPGDLGLAHAGVALEEQRAPEPQGQEHGGGQPLVGQVVVGRQARDHVVDVVGERRRTGG